jgi:hypothetical protein
MRGKLYAMRARLAILLFWRWQFWHDSRWRKNVKWSACSWMFSALLFAFAFSNWRHGLLFLVAWTLLNDVANYVINRKRIFPDRHVSFKYSGSASLAAGIFCFTYHKAVLLLLAIVFGLGAYWIIGIQGAIGILENPIRYKYNKNYAFRNKH